MMPRRYFTWILLSTFIGVDIVSSQSQGDLRLRGTGSNTTQGRIEVFYNNQWGTVCDDGFGNEEAIVACRQLGSPNPSLAVVVTDGRFGPGSGPIHMDNLICAATETRLETCRFNGWGDTDCSHAEDVGVICQASSGQPVTTLVPPTTKAPIVPDTGNCSTPDPDIRLVGPANKPGVGVVQVRRNNQWGTLCDDNWDVRDATVVCRMLCFDPAKSLAGSIAFNTLNITEPMTINNVQCNGNELSITNCEQSEWMENSCGRNEMARVTCTEMNNEAPRKPQPILECTDGYLSASFSLERDPFLETKHLSVHNTYTGACNVVMNEDDDFITIRIPFDECGTERSSNNTHMIYKNVIKYLPTNNVGEVSFANTYIVKVQCELPRDVLADKPIEPLTETVTQSAPGEFIVNMHFYENSLPINGGDNSFSVPVTTFPLQIPLGEWLNTALELNDVDENLRLVIPNCFATPSANRNNSIKYPLFTDKCVDDQTVGFFPINDTWWGYRYQTFKFVAFSEVHIHCDAYICDKDDTSEECDRSCFPATTTSTTTPAGATTAAGPQGADGNRVNRKKRSFARRYTHVSSPTIIVMDMDSPSGIVRPGGSQEPSTSTVVTRKPTSTVKTPTSKTTQKEIVKTESPHTTVKQTTLKPTTIKIQSEVITPGPEFGRTEASKIEAIYVSGNGAGALFKTSTCAFTTIFLILLRFIRFVSL